MSSNKMLLAILCLKIVLSMSAPIPSSRLNDIIDELERISRTYQRVLSYRQVGYDNIDSSFDPHDFVADADVDSVIARIDEHESSGQQGPIFERHTQIPITVWRPVVIRPGDEEIGQPIQAGDYVHDDQQYRAIVNELFNRAQQRPSQSDSTLTSKALESIPIVRAGDVMGTSSHEQQVDCPICIESYHQDDRVRKLKCNHVFHDICITTWLRQSQSCPVCRSSLQ